MLALACQHPWYSFWFTIAVALLSLTSISPCCAAVYISAGVTAIGEAPSALAYSSHSLLPATRIRRFLKSSTLRTGLLLPNMVVPVYQVPSTLAPRRCSIWRSISLPMSLLASASARRGSVPNMKGRP